jgi:Uma2 family endonuclease
MSTARRSRGVRTRRWSKREYYQMGELGFFQGQRVELIEGQIMVLSPQNAQHAGMIDLVSEILRNVFGPSYRVRAQLPLDLGQTTEPEPDLAVVLGIGRQFLGTHPTGAVLIVEISDTTVSYDRRRKGSLYARAGILDYWIINLRRRQVEVYRSPVPDPSRPYGHRYSARTDLMPPAAVSPLALPGASILVADLLP